MTFGCQSMIGKLESVLIKPVENAFISQENLESNYEAFRYFGCPNYDKARAEFEQFKSILKAHVPNVYALPQNDGTGLDSVYAHDTVKITKNGAIYFPMGKKLRAGEPAATEAYLQSLGVPTLGHIIPPGKMEGGDVLWLDERTVAIGLGYRTNEEGIRQFKQLTQGLVDDYFIVQLPHGDGEDCCLHLMSLISMVSQDKAVVYSKYMPVVFRNYLLARNIQLFECNDKEYDYLGSNLLALEPNKVMLIKGCPEIETQLVNAGVTVLTYEGFDLSYKGTGGPTCLTCPILRL